MAAKAIRQSPELELLQALQAARAAANTLIAAEKGSVERNGKIEEFDTVPFAEVQAEERRLSAAHGLLLWTDSVSTVRVDDYGSELHARFTLVHLASGASKSFEFVGPCFPLSEHNGNGAWASEATKKYAWRCAVLQIFDIPVVKKSALHLQNGPVHVAASPTAPAHTPKNWQPYTGSATSTLPVASMASQRQPYTAERMLEQLQIWDDNQRAIAVASGDLWDSLPLPAAWAACRRSAKGAGIKIRPLMPGDKPNGEQEYAELYDFLYAENLRDGLLS